MTEKEAIELVDVMTEEETVTLVCKMDELISNQKEHIRYLRGIIESRDDIIKRYKSLIADYKVLIKNLTEDRINL